MRFILQKTLYLRSFAKYVGVRVYFLFMIDKLCTLNKWRNVCISRVATGDYFFYSFDYQFFSKMLFNLKTYEKGIAVISVLKNW